MGLFKNMESSLINKLNNININNSLEYIINDINTENITHTENGDYFNLFLNNLILGVLLNNPDFNNWEDYKSEEIFNLLNGYYK